ncbi:hypothetical protein [Pedobacter nototheniae]|uniref:hypothetical protein n=1 Tax=Pedobacter nototheniae TaxID=2488994 RepID=UPI001040AC95|nr:hypothetical protein [Pedobacter nototheniae]
MKRVFYVLLAGIIIILISLYFNLKTETRLNKATLEDLNLQLTGIVYKVDKVKGYNGFGIADLKIINSNIKNYDPRSKNDYYYCIIKNGKIEIYDIVVNAMTIGDTIKIDTKNKTILYKNEGRKEEGTIMVNTDDGFYNYIKKHHQKL